MVKTYEELYHEVVRRAELERSAVTSLDPKIIAERIAKTTERDTSERVHNMRGVVNEAFFINHAR